MLKTLRATSCPLCGRELGALIGEEWVAMRSMNIENTPHWN